jgi:hypothetical protein
MSDPSHHPGAESDTPARTERESSDGTPRWVKVSAIVFGILVLLIVIVFLVGGGPLGGHGPGRHISGSQPTGQFGQQAPVSPPAVAGFEQ